MTRNPGGWHREPIKHEAGAWSWRGTETCRSRSREPILPRCAVLPRKSSCGKACFRIHPFPSVPVGDCHGSTARPLRPASFAFVLLVPCLSRRNSFVAPNRSKPTNPSFSFGWHAGQAAEHRPDRKEDSSPLKRKTKGKHDTTASNTSRSSFSRARRRDAHQKQARELFASGALRVLRKTTGPNTCLEDGGAKKNGKGRDKATRWSAARKCLHSDERDRSKRTRVVWMHRARIGDWERTDPIQKEEWNSTIGATAKIEKEKGGERGQEKS